MKGIKSTELLRSMQAPKVNIQNGNFRPGQILAGRILEIYPHHRAAVQLAGVKLTAQLETPLNLHEKYWFQVQSVGELLRMKVLIDKPFQKRKQAVEQLMNQLDIGRSRSSYKFLNELINHQVPFEKENLKQAIMLLEQVGLSTISTKIVLEMLLRNLPISPSIYQALSTINHTNLDEQLTIMAAELATIKNPSPSQKDLIETIERFYDSSDDPKNKFLIQLKNMLALTGLNHENSILNESLKDIGNRADVSLKSLLLHVLQETGQVNSNKLERFLHFINGSQLNQYQENEQLIQLNFQVPGKNLGLKQSVEISLESHKKENGQINSDFCNILFYLELESMKETVIDLSIQKRVVNVTIFNNHPHLNLLCNSLKPKLKQGLEALNYHLSSVRTKPIMQEESEPIYSDSRITKPHSQGVDYRI